MNGQGPPIQVTPHKLPQWFARFQHDGPAFEGQTPCAFQDKFLIFSLGAALDGWIINPPSGWRCLGCGAEPMLWAVWSDYCCADHTVKCEPPGDLCCAQCPEGEHPDKHPDGVPCVLDVDPTFLHPRDSQAR